MQAIEEDPECLLTGNSNLTDGSIRVGKLILLSPGKACTARELSRRYRWKARDVDTAVALLEGMGVMKSQKVHKQKILYKAPPAVFVMKAEDLQNAGINLTEVDYVRNYNYKDTITVAGNAPIWDKELEEANSNDTPSSTQDNNQK